MMFIFLDIGKVQNGLITVPYAKTLTNRKYQPPELINISERNEPRALLSADVYGFACIAWVSGLTFDKITKKRRYSSSS